MPEKREVIGEVLRKLEGAESGYHSEFISKVDRRYNAYHGVLKAKSEAARWRSKKHFPHLYNIAEAIIANLVEDKLSFRVYPAPRVTDDLMSIRQASERARAIEYLLRHEHRVDKFRQSVDTYVRQGVVCGMTVGKMYWRKDMQEIPRFAYSQRNVTDPNTGVNLGAIDVPDQSTSITTVFDNSCWTPVDIRDFIWNESAPSLEKAQWVIHRLWMSFEELEALQAQGIYKNVDSRELKESRDQSQGQYAHRNGSSDLFDPDRTKGLIEVLEHWERKSDGLYVTTLANRATVLRGPVKSPFWHGQFPFTVCSNQRDLFKLPGISDIQLIEQVQEMLWTLANQRIDNLQLVNNMITLIRADVEDPDAFEYAPGERWLVEDVDQVKQLEFDTKVAEVSLNAEAILKGELQNLAGGGALLTGAQTQEIDQKTATGVSIVQSNMQKRLMARRRVWLESLEEEASLRIKVCQQFIKRDRLVHVVGPEGALHFLSITPEELQGDFLVEYDPTSESMMRQERRAEGQALTQVLGQLLPFSAAQQTPLSVKALVKYLLRQFDIEDYEQFFADPQTAQAMMQAMMQGGGSNGNSAGAPAGAGQPGTQGMMPNMGTTSPLASDANSPSNSGSMDGMMMLQRALASQGGGQNA